MASRVAPSSLARETPTAAPRALKEPVGSRPSSLTSSRGRPSSAPRRGAGSSGVIPSPRVTTCSAAETGQQLVVAPEVRRPAGDDARVAADAREVVPRQQRRPVTRAQPLEHGRVVRRAAPRALQVVEGAEAHRSIKPATPRRPAPGCAAGRRADAGRPPTGCRGGRPRRGPRAGRAGRTPACRRGSGSTCTLRRSSGSVVRRIRPSSSSGESRADRAPRLSPSCSASSEGCAVYGEPSRRSASRTLNDARPRSSSANAASRDRARCLVSSIRRATTCSWSGSIHGSSRSHSAT